MSPAIAAVELVNKSYAIPILGGTINGDAVYSSLICGYRLYNLNIALDSTWDGVDAIDYLSVYNIFNWVWHLEQKVGTSWAEIKPASMTITKTQDADGCYVTRQGILADGSSFTVKYSLPNNGSLKFSLTYSPKKTSSYRLRFEISGLQDFDTNNYLQYTKPNNKRVHFLLPSYAGDLTVDFDYNDVSAILSQAEEFDAINYKYNYYVELGTLKGGTLYSVDPTVISTSAGQYATASGYNRKLFRDAYGKYIAIHANANIHFDYCNNDPPISGWVDNDLGVTYAVSIAAPYRGIAGAYDAFNDRLCVAYGSGVNVKVFNITLTRSGGNITGFTAGSILTVAGAWTSADGISLWMLHQGDVGLTWGDVGSGGNKHTVIKFIRVVGTGTSAPTYKNAAGQDSQIDVINTDPGSSANTRTCIIQRTNSGTGQYDLFALWHSAGIASQKNKATWSSPNWSWGSPVTTTVSVLYGLTANYDSSNGLIVYCGPSNAAATTIPAGIINASDTDTDISKTGLTSLIRDYTSIAINQNNGDYYVFYGRASAAPFDLYYIKRSGGSWGAETQFTTTLNERFPSCKVNEAGGRIELVWTHYTGAAYNVYYDAITLQVLKEVVDSLSLSDAILRNKTFTVSDSVGLAETPLKNWSPLISDVVGLADTVLRNRTFQIADSLSLADQIALIKLFQILDSIGLSDVILRNKQLMISDALIVVDAILRNKIFTILDSVGLSDVPLKHWTPRIVDAVSLTDTVLRNRVLQILDAFGLTDTVLRDKTLAISDTVSLTELIDVITGAIIQYVTDLIGLSDSVLRDKLLSLTDNVSLSELVKAANLLEAPILILTRDGHLILRLTKPTQKKPEYILLR